MRTFALRLAFALAVPLSVGLIQSAQGGETKTHKVEITGFKFVPPILRVRVGDIIIFTNRDLVPHTASQKLDGWDSGMIKRSEAWSLMIETPGSFEYYCRFHPSMKANILVRS